MRLNVNSTWVLRTLIAAALIGCGVAQARTHPGEKPYAEAAAAAERGDWDAALSGYQKALQADPSNIAYKLAMIRAQFQCGQSHVDRGRKIRDKGQLTEALAEFEKAVGINPASSVAAQEVRRTQAMIERAKVFEQKNGRPPTPVEAGLTPIAEAERDSRENMARMLPAPELRPLSPAPICLKMSNQPPKVLFETIGKTAGVNVLFDPDYQPGKNASLELTNATLTQALDYVALLTKSFYKPLSANAIFVSNENPAKRREYDDYVTRVFYLSNINTVQELQEIMTAVRTVTELQRVAQFSSQYAIVVRGEVGKVALAQRLISNLDQPRSEVVVDILVIEASKTFSRQVSTAIAASGLNLSLSPAPRSSILANTTTSSSSTSTDTTSTTSVMLSSLRHLSSADFAANLPSAILQAALSDANTRVVQSPQLRSVDNMKASLRIGDRQPTATGSYSGLTSGTVSALVNTQFQYIDVGVNVDMMPRVHDNGDVSLHIELEISSVTGHVTLGGIDEPVIGQRKVVHDIRMRAGEVGLLGGLSNSQDSRTVTGIPGLASLPIIGKLFSGESISRANGDFLIALVPHIVRAPAALESDQLPVSAGTATNVHLNYADPPEGN